MFIPLRLCMKLVPPPTSPPPHIILRGSTFQPLPNLVRLVSCRVDVHQMLPLGCEGRVEYCRDGHDEHVLGGVDGHRPGFHHLIVVFAREQRVVGGGGEGCAIVVAAMLILILLLLLPLLLSALLVVAVRCCC